MGPQTPAKRGPPPGGGASPAVRAKLGMSPSTPSRRESGTAGSQGIVMMTLDVTEEAQGRFHIWGKTMEGEVVLMRVTDFLPYFYIAAPVLQVTSQGESREEEVEWNEGRCRHIHEVLNRELPPDVRIHTVVPHMKRPILYYRPGQPDKTAFLQLLLSRGTNLTKAAKSVETLIKKGTFRSLNYVFRDANMYEHEVKLQQRFQVDACVSGGAWLHIPPSSPSARAIPPSPVTPSLPGPGAPRAVLGYTPIARGDQISTADLEVVVPWRAIQCLSPDATQLAGGEWQPAPYTAAGTSAGGPVCERWEKGRHAASEGHIQPLTLMTLDVVLAPKDGKARVPVAANDPIVAIACVVHSSAEVTQGPATPSAGGSGGGADEGDEEGLEDMGLADETEQRAGGSLATGPSSGDKVTFMWVGGSAAHTLTERVSGTHVQIFGSEVAMLQAWLSYVQQHNPDAFLVFQVKDNLGALSARFAALRINGGGLHLSRMQRDHSRQVGIRSVIQYRPNWVKNQQRMASTSNQETFRADIDGRLVFDILRQVLSTVNLAMFSLAECVQVLLGRRLEVLPPAALAALAGMAPANGSAVGPTTPAALAGRHEGARESQDCKSLRIARYLAVRAEAIRQLLKRLATVPETIELARAAGLTIPQILYNAQMIRTWSLLLRNAQRKGYAVSGRQDGLPLNEGPFLMHPVEAGTVGLYRHPVVILDFASLYPSLYRAYNLDYATLLHPDDVSKLPPEDVITTPAGASFVRSEVRAGVLPSILAALMTARSATRAVLKGITDPTQRAILDSRQKALKLMANALYGFTGAQASNLQCVPIADSCLALGAQSTRRANEVIAEAAASGQLGPKALDARVIYSQTDSVFVLFPSVGPAEAIRLGKEAARLASAVFPSPMQLQYEKVACPFLLLHVNRYAGRAFEKEEETAGPGALMVKGLKSMWRQAAPIVRITLQGALQRIIMQGDVKAAVTFVEGQVRRLLSGRVETWELVMTGGMWRITGQQVAQAAADADESGPPSANVLPDDVEVRGPHASLAVRLKQRDEGRSFVLGERLGYVLLPGCRTQDDAAEDPLAAAKLGLTPDLELYWRNKLLRPLTEIFKTCLSPAELSALTSGPHTMVRVDAITSPPSGPTSPPSGVRGWGRSPASRRQTGLSAFYKTTLKCLNCRRAPHKAATAEGKGLCEECEQEEGVATAVYLDFQRDANQLADRRCYTHALCGRCHSGGMSGPVLCENAECSVLYARLGSQSRLAAVDQSLRRIEW